MSNEELQKAIDDITSSGVSNAPETSVRDGATVDLPDDMTRATMAATPASGGGMSILTAAGGATGGGMSASVAEELSKMAENTKNVPDMITSKADESAPGEEQPKKNGLFGIIGRQSKNTEDINTQSVPNPVSETGMTAPVSEVNPMMTAQNVTSFVPEAAVAASVPEVNTMVPAQDIPNPVAEVAMTAPVSEVNPMMTAQNVTSFVPEAAVAASVPEVNTMEVAPAVPVVTHETATSEVESTPVNAAGNNPNMTEVGQVSEVNDQAEVNALTASVATGQVNEIGEVSDNLAPEVGVSRDADMEKLRKDALLELYPLLKKMKTNPRQKFEICLRVAEMGERVALKEALEAAREMTDENEKGEALFKIVEMVER